MNFITDTNPPFKMDIRLVYTKRMCVKIEEIMSYKAKL